MMRQRQLPSEICSTEPVVMATYSLQDKCAIPTPHKPSIMCYSPICQKQTSNKGKVFFRNISYATYIHTYCCCFKPLEYSLKPPKTRIKNDNNLSRQGH